MAEIRAVAGMIPVAVERQNIATPEIYRGIQAELRRHFREGKSVHWYIDDLINVVDRLVALAPPGRSECGIVERLLRSKRFEPALPGFDRTDRGRCPTSLSNSVDPDQSSDFYDSTSANHRDLSQPGFSAHFTERRRCWPRPIFLARFDRASA